MNPHDHGNGSSECCKWCTLHIAQLNSITTDLYSSVNLIHANLEIINKNNVLSVQNTENDGILQVMNQS